jgi:HlyD family secretion protein
MKKKSIKNISIILLFSCSLTFFTACNKNQNDADASGSFEAQEVIVSAEQSGKLLSFDIEEGDVITTNKLVGQIDISTLNIQQEQVEASMQTLTQKTNNPGPQIELVKKQLEVQKTNYSYLLNEKQRIANLLKADAATQKQFDDITAKAEEAQKQMNVTEQQLVLYSSNINTQNNAILSEKGPMEKSVKQLQNQMSKAQIFSPITGTVLTKYAMAGELTAMGKALFKIANLDTMTLRVYITGSQLSQVKLGQKVKVFVDNGEDAFKELSGNIYWISDKSEFTPKTIQTKDERANLVYATKIRVKNDGFLKIGMYGEVKF